MIAPDTWSVSTRSASTPSYGVYFQESVNSRVDDTELKLNAVNTLPHHMPESHCSPGLTTPLPQMPGVFDGVGVTDGVADGVAAACAAAGHMPSFVQNVAG